MTVSGDHSESRWPKILFQGSVGVLVVVDVVSVAAMILGNVWVGEWLWVSPSAFSTTFIGTAVMVRRRGLGYMDAFLVSLTTMVSMIWMYEIFYHFGFYVDWEFGTQAQAAALTSYNQPVVIDFLLASVGLVGLKYMRVGLPFFVSFACLMAVFVTWVVIGYPQVTTPGSLYPFGGIFVRVPNPDAWAYPLNILTKYLLAFSYISLYVGEPTNRSD